MLCNSQVQCCYHVGIPFLPLFIFCQGCDGISVNDDLWFTGNEATPFIVNPQMMVQTAFGNFPQPAPQHFQAQSPVYASQVIHPTMMVQDPLVRISQYVIIFMSHIK